MVYARHQYPDLLTNNLEILKIMYSFAPSY